MRIFCSDRLRLAQLVNRQHILYRYKEMQCTVLTLSIIEQEFVVRGLRVRRNS